MVRKFPYSGIFILLLLAASTAQAQTTVRGYIFLPNGEPVSKQVQFTLSSDDGILNNDIRFTDSQGRFILERLNGRMSYTIRVQGDGVEYDNTEYSFVPQYVSSPRVILNPIRKKAETPAKKNLTVGGGTSRAASPAAAIHTEAQQAIRREQFAEAEGLLKKALAADAKFVPALVDLGVLQMRQKKFTEAEKLLRTAVELDPRAALAHLNLGIALSRQNRFADAIAPLRQALVLDPESNATHAYLGIALVETEKYEEAETHLLRGLKATTTEEILCDLYLGNLYARTGKYGESIRYLEIYLQRLPNAANAGEVRELIAQMKKQPVRQ